MSIYSTLSIDHSNISFLPYVHYLSYFHLFSPSVEPPSTCFFYPSPTPLSYTPSLYFSKKNVLLLHFSLFTLSLLSLSIATLLSFLLSLLFTVLSLLLPFLNFAFHALVFPSGNAYSSSEIGRA